MRATFPRPTGWPVVLLLCASGTAAQSLPAASPARFSVGPNLRASANLASGGRNECWVSVSPTNGRFIAAVAQASADNLGTTIGTRRCSTSISRNGGRTWREVTLPGQEDGCFDPMTAFDAEGRLYVLHTMMGRNMGADIAGGSERREGSIRVWSTTDEGRTWSGPAELKAPLAPDHPRMVVDTSSGPHRGRVYVAWNEVSDTLLKQKYHVFLHYSDDNGKTFSDPQLLVTDDGGKLVVTEPLVLSDGTLLVTYYKYFWPLSSPRNDRQPVWALRSADGAATFGAPEKMFDVGSSAWRHLRRDFGRAFTLPIFTADTSPASPTRDRLFAVWDDVGASESNIWLTMSNDKGRTWSAPRRLNDNPKPAEGTPPDFRMTPVVAVNAQGHVAVAWYDRREDPSRRCWKYYGSVSLDGGTTFGPNQPISSAPSCPEKDLAPTVYVWNAAEEFDDTLPTDAELASMKLDMTRRGLEEEVGIAKAWREASAADRAARLRVAFDRGRNSWPGHYTGLAAGTDGAFHAVWADRRSVKLQQLYAARLDVATAPEPAPPATTPTSITERIQVIGGAGTFDEAKGTATFEIQLRNVSNASIYGPIRLRVARIATSAAGPTATIVDPDGGSPAAGVWWDFSTRLGSRNRLDPGAISEARTVTIKVRPETGLDGVFDFEVTGGVPRAAATAAAPAGKGAGR